MTARHLPSRWNVLKINFALQYDLCKTHCLAVTGHFWHFCLFFHSSWPNRSPFFGTYSQNWGKISSCIRKIVQKILLQFSDPPEKRTVWALQTVFGIFADLRDVRGVKTPLSSVSIKKFASHEICPICSATSSAILKKIELETKKFCKKGIFGYGAWPPKGVRPNDERYLMMLRVPKVSTVQVFRVICWLGVSQ